MCVCVAINDVLLTILSLPAASGSMCVPGRSQGSDHITVRTLSLFSIHITPEQIDPAKRPSLPTRGSSARSTLSPLSVHSTAVHSTLPAWSPPLPHAPSTLPPPPPRLVHPPRQCPPAASRPVPRAASDHTCQVSGPRVKCQEHVVTSPGCDPAWSLLVERTSAQH